MNKTRRMCEYCQQSYAANYICKHRNSCPKKDILLYPQSRHNVSTEIYNENEEIEVDMEVDINTVNVTDEAELENVPQHQNQDLGDDDDEDDDIIDEEFLSFLLEDAIDGSEGTRTDTEEGSYVHWICILLAEWQRSFNITDNALEFLLQMFPIIFSSIKLSDVFIKKIIKLFPSSLYKFQKHFSFNKNFDQRFTVCPKCCSLYKPTESITRYRGENESAKCSFFRFPHHRQNHYRNKKCEQELMKTSISHKGEKLLYPHHIYCYRSIKESFKLLLYKENFENLCEKWRNLKPIEGVMSDVYDGQIWKTFAQNNEWYFKNERHYGVMLNVDWFQPYKHLSSYSVGAIYLIIMNLPREERFKRENLILVGVIPNMSTEPPTNTFIEPLVEELLEAWNPGFTLYSKLSGACETFKLALLCVGCDIPATRKLCGFLSHSAKHGCSKCEKVFPGPVGLRNYGGFDINNWIPRDTGRHRLQMEEILEASSLADRNKLESNYGTRFSILSHLPYFDTIRMSTIDPMHNLFLGTAKNILKVWKDLGYIDRASLVELQSKSDEFVVPHDVGKIPKKIQSSFDGFTADEYKNWTLLFSVYCLHDVIPKRDVDCFRKFVLACQYLCRQVISIRDVTVAHELLVQFCKSFEQLYGAERVTPNMHLHCHLKECLLDFGPIYAFWLFSFERYNGLLGGLPNNKKNIEVQLMKRFCRDSIVMNLEKPDFFAECFSVLSEKLVGVHSPRGSLNDMSFGNMIVSLQLSSRLLDPINQDWFENSHILCKRKVSVHSLGDLQLDYITQAYKFLYPDINWNSFSVSVCYVRSSELFVFGNQFGSSASKNWRSSYITAFWCGNNGEIAKFDELGLTPRPGIIRYFLKHVLLNESSNLVHWFAYCEWFRPVSIELKQKYGKPVEVWDQELMEQHGPASYIPVSRIISKCVFVKKMIGTKKVIVVIPRSRVSCF